MHELERVEKCEKCERFTFCKTMQMEFINHFQSTVWYARIHQTERQYFFKNIENLSGSSKSRYFSFTSSHQRPKPAKVNNTEIILILKWAHSKRTIFSKQFTVAFIQLTSRVCTRCPWWMRNMRNEKCQKPFFFCTFSQFVFQLYGFPR